MRFSFSLRSGQLEQPPAWFQAGLNVLLLAAWLVLYAPVVGYLVPQFFFEEFRTNEVLLLGVAVLLALRLRDSGLKFDFTAAPRLHLPALLLALAGSLGFLLAEYYLDINILAAVLCGLASYGLLGLWLEPARWRAGFPAMLLVVGILPFGELIEIFLGYPVRVTTARMVAEGLRAAGFPSLGSDTILVFESGISQVDIPCSGVKSLWTGMLFWLAATWIENRPLNLRWLLLAGLFGALLLVANLTRVTLLVLVGQVAGLRLAAELIHLPLGVLGFGAACGAGLLLLRAQPPAPAERPAAAASRPGWLTPVLLAAALGMVMLYQPRPSEPAAPDSGWVLTWQQPVPWNSEPAPLTPAELGRITRFGAESAQRTRFHWNGLSGTLMLVASRSWRAQHSPELCFEVYGLTIESSLTRLLTPDFPLKTLSLSAGDSAALYSAAYWFQSAGRTTEDYAARIWADLAPRRARWVLVTVLWDAAPAPDEASHISFYTTLQAAVAGGLTEGVTP